MFLHRQWGKIPAFTSHLRANNKKSREEQRCINFKSSLAVLAAAIMLPAAAQAQTKITIGIPTSPPNIVHMPAIVAKELGLYKKAGLDVDIVSLGDGVKVYRALLAGNIEFGLTPGAPTIIGRSNGAAVKALSANLPKFEASMVVRSEIKTMADLKGKRIGIQEPGGFADLLSRSVLRAAKIDPKEVNFVTHRERGRSGARRQPGRYCNLARRAGNIRQDQGAGPARHRAHVGAAAEDALYIPVGD